MTAEFISALIVAFFATMLLIVGILLFSRKSKTSSFLFFAMSGGLWIAILIILAYVDSNFNAAIGSLAAVGASVLAGVTIKANRDLRKEDSKEKKLKEIIDWAIDATNGKLTDEIKQYAWDFNYKERLGIAIDKNGKILLPQSAPLFGKNKYILNVAATIQGSNKLEKSIKHLNDELYFLTKVNEITSPDKIKIYDAANDVIEKATALL
jgi:hypothetical protein